LGLFLIPVVSAVNPTDRDGGSNGDAGDHARLAKVVLPGTFTGTLTATTDGHDFYAFTASAGQLLRIRYTSGDPATPMLALMTANEAVYRMFSDGAEEKFLVPHTGTWILWAWMQYATNPVTYTISFGFEGAPDKILSATDSSWQVAEARWSAPTSIRAYAFASLIDDKTDPSSQFVMVEWFGHHPGMKGWFSFHWSTTATGRRLVPGGLTVPADVQWTVTEGGMSLVFPMTSDYGSVRISVYTTDPDGETVASIWGTGQLEKAKAEGNDLVVWSDSSGALSQTQLPGYAITGPRDFTLNVNRRFVGDFEPWGHQSWIRKPNGQLHYGSKSFIPLADPGTWQFHLEQTSGIGQQADRVYLDGGFLPALGLAKQWVCGAYGCQDV
jgi:hypothetical protein